MYIDKLRLTKRRLTFSKTYLFNFSKRTGKQTSPSKNKHLSNQLSEAVSPDGKRKLTVNKWSNRERVSTYLVIQFERTSGPIFGTTGINPDIKAYWKDNNSIIIETKKNYIIDTNSEL